MAVSRDQEGADTPVAPSLVMFSHCERDIYSSCVPQQCPLCGQNPVSSWDLAEAPVSIPSPFGNAHRGKCSFVLRPTTGRFLGPPSFTGERRIYERSWEPYSHHVKVRIRERRKKRVLIERCGLCLHMMLSHRSFYRTDKIYWVKYKNGQRVSTLTCAFLREYDGSSDLHVGITSSKGTVHHYNETGTHKDTTGWEQCVSIPLVPPDQYALIHQWDYYLEEFSCNETWLPSRYDEKEHNCYTYALKFINSLLHLQEKKTFTKEEFTEKFVLPKTRRVSKYITLCHEVSRNYYYMVDHPR